MKKYWLSLLTLALIITVASSAPVLARKDNDKNNCVGELLWVEGTVDAFSALGLVIMTAEGDKVTVHSIGPDWYWRHNNTSRPSAGDEVYIEYSEVDSLGEGEYVLVYYENLDNGESLLLRDEFCIPLWLDETPHQHRGIH